MRHDWLTRPIPGTALLLEKAVFIVLVICLPSILGAVVYHLYLGHSVAESLLAGVSSGARGDMLLAIVVGMAFAAVTTGIRQGIVVFLAAIVGVAVMSVLLSNIYHDAPPPTVTGSDWVILRSVQFSLALASVGVLWVQYRRRHTNASLVLATGAWWPSLRP